MPLFTINLLQYIILFALYEGNVTSYKHSSQSEKYFKRHFRSLDFFLI